MRRRSVLRMTGATTVGALAGCTDDSGGDGGGDGNDVQDSDGDGVVDSEDYAPRDESVQEKSDLDEASTGADTTSTGHETASTEPTPEDVEYPSHSGEYEITARANYWAWEFSLPTEFVLEYTVRNLRDENYDFDVLLYPPDRFETYRAIATERQEGIRPTYLDGSAPGVRSGVSNVVRFQPGTYYLVVDNTDLSDAGDWGTEDPRRVRVDATTRPP